VISLFSRSSLCVSDLAKETLVRKPGREAALAVAAV
jgi:hypothetical protein